MAPTTTGLTAQPTTPANPAHGPVYTQPHRTVSPQPPARDPNTHTHQYNNFTPYSLRSSRTMIGDTPPTMPLASYAQPSPLNGHSSAMQMATTHPRKAELNGSDHPGSEGGNRKKFWFY